ncbi:ninein-like protein [Protopterus annectens]|uniref:ninein-like protein n=1 Tax=Protopterus annectens TaxID=7888 RepID=UPI001CFB1C7D|nr:ninein-like protein [Protopterus annectens]
MDKVEDNQYVAQLKGVFDTCDTTGTGYLDKEELTELCHKLHLDAQLPVLLDTLLGADHYARVDFDEFKEGFVAVLSSNVDLCISEDETSYLDPAVPDEIQPKYIRGSKRYGRRSHPESQDCDVDGGRDFEVYQVHNSKKGQLRRSASLESLESLKSDEEPESNKELQNEMFEAQGQLRAWNPSLFESPRRTSSPYSDVTENQVQAIWEDIGVGNNGFLNRQELAAVCQNIGLGDLKTEELDDLFKNLDRDKDGRVSFKEFQHGLFSHGPTSLSSCSTPFKQKKASVHQAFEESRANTPSLLSSTVGLRLFSCLNNGTGYASPEQIVSIWKEEGIDNGKEILEALDFNVEEKVELAELSIALDNELMVNNNKVHQAAFASYRNEVQYLNTRVGQLSRERDKIKMDLEKAEKRNFQLVREVDDHHSVMEQLNESKIKDLEQEYREKLTAIKTEMDLERESVAQQTNKQRTELQAEVDFLQAEESQLRERLSLFIKENHRLQNELVEVAEKLAQSEAVVSKLQTDIDFMVKDKFALLDPQSTELFNQEERFAEVIKEFEQQCRELRDRNDELQNELEAMHAQLQERKPKLNMPTKSENRHGHSGTSGRGISSMEGDSASVSIDKELMVEKMKEYQQEVRDLKIQLETKVNYYERQIELMKKNFEGERKDIEQSFKLEISEVEEQRADLEEEVVKLKGIIDELKKSTQSQEVDRKFEKERSEMEQYYAKEIASLAQRLTREKDQLEEDLKEKHQQELQVARKRAEVDSRQLMAQIEAQRHENEKVALERHQRENEVLVKRFEFKIKKLVEQHELEQNKWKTNEKERMIESKRERLKLEEHLREEQVAMCNAFALEREAIESKYKEHVNQLNDEIDYLKAQVVEMQKALRDCEELAKHSRNSKHIDMKEEQDGQVYEDDVLQYLQFPSPPQNKRDETLGRKTEQDLSEIRQEEHIVNHQEGQVHSQSEEHHDLCRKRTDITNWHCNQCSAQQKTSKNECSWASKDLKDLICFPLEQHMMHRKEDVCINTSQKKEENPEGKKEQSEKQRCLKAFPKHKQTEFFFLEENAECLHTQIEDLQSVLHVLQYDLQCEREENKRLIEQIKQYRQPFNELNSEELIFTEKENNSAFLSQERSNTVCILDPICENRLKEEHVQEAHTKPSDEKANLYQQLALVKNTKVEHQSLTGMKQGLSKLHWKCEVIQHRPKTLLFVPSQKSCFPKKAVQFMEQSTCPDQCLSFHQKGDVFESSQLMDKEQDDCHCLQNCEGVAGGDKQTFSQRENEELAKKLLELEDIVRRIEMDTRDNCRNWSSVLSEENCSLKVQLGKSEQKIQSLELEINQQKKELDELKTCSQKVVCEMEDLSKQNENFRDELSQLNFKNLQLISENSDLTAKMESNLNTIHKLSTQLTELACQKEESSVVAMQLQEALSKLERVQFEHQFEWEQEKKLMDEELQKYREKVQRLSELENEMIQLAYKNDGLMQELQDSKEKFLEASTSLAVTQSQHAQEVLQLKEYSSAISKDQLDQLQCRLSEEKQKVHKLQEQLNFQATQANRQMVIQQEECEQTVQKKEKIIEDLESNLKILHVMLQEKVVQLKEQLTKIAKSDTMLKDLYVENAQLMKALQITEQRQKSAEKKNFVLEEKITALNRLLCRVAPTSLAV